MNKSDAREKSTDHLWVWGSDAHKPRFLHTMLQVRDLEASLRFYIDGLGMKLLDTFEFEAERATAVFIGFEDYDVGGCLELVMFWDADKAAAPGVRAGHISIGVPDIASIMAKLEPLGAQVTIQPVVVLKGGPEIAFVKDLDGYAIELIQTRRI